jgi:hypothetical protein
MLYRLVSVAIVVFWLLMTTLLIRNEVNPGGSSLREVPVTHVFKQLFIHEQRSNLRIYNGGTPIGFVYMYPHVEKDTEARILELNGTLLLDVGPNKKQRISWETVFQMGPAFEVECSEYRIRLHDPGDLLAEVRSRADQPLVHARLSSKDGVVEFDMPLNQSGIEGVAQRFGATGDVLTTLQQLLGGAQQSGPNTKPQIRARQSSLRLDNEQRTETFLVSVEYNGQKYLECHFSQLGQALKATTYFGYTLQDESLP